MNPNALLHLLLFCSASIVIGISSNSGVGWISGYFVNGLALLIYIATDNLAAKDSE